MIVNECITSKEKSILLKKKKFSSFYDNFRVALIRRGDEVVQKVIDMALEGDKDCLRMCMERLIPKMSLTYLKGNLTVKADTIDDLKNASSRIIEAVSNGEIASEEAAGLTNLIDLHQKLLVSSELEKRIEKLEQKDEK